MIKDIQEEFGSESTAIVIPSIWDRIEMAENHDFWFSFSLEKSIPENIFYPRYDQSYLINVYESFDQFKIKKWINQEEVIIHAKPNDLKPGDPSIVSKWEFIRNFNEKTDYRFIGFDWSNIVLTGGMITSCLLGQDEGYEQSDINIYFYGLSQIEIIDRIRGYIKSLGDDFENYSMIKTLKGSISLCKHYPYRHLSFQFEPYVSISHILITNDINCSSFAFDGANVYGLYRSMESINYRCNFTSKNSWILNGDTHYQNRLIKYCNRGFSIVSNQLKIFKNNPDFDPHNNHSGLSLIVSCSQDEEVLNFVKSSILTIPYGPTIKKDQFEIQIKSPMLISRFQRYILSDNSNNSYSYQYRIIQYKDIETLKLNIRNDDYFTTPGDKEEEEEELLPKVRDFFLKLCPNIKNIQITTYLSHRNNKCYGDALFTFEKHKLYFDVEYLPVSNDQEDEDIDEGDEEDVYLYNYSFEMLGRIKPRKLLIDTQTDMSYTMPLKCIDNVLNYKSIKSIKFGCHPVPYWFFERVLSNESGVESLRVEIENRGYLGGMNIPRIHSRSDSNSESESESKLTPNAEPMKEMILRLLSKNTTLKRLVIKDLPISEYSMFFECIQQNKESKIKALGFGTIPFKKHSISSYARDYECTPTDLEPLHQLPNITTLYCHIDSIQQYLQHEFEAAAKQAKDFTKKPSNEELLELYALYKQATAGDVQGTQPWAVQVEARAKYDAWATKKGISQTDAEAQYIAYVAKLATSYQ
eukprot:gene4949-6166_t